MKTGEMTKTALLSAVICILAPLSIPIGAVPISFTNLVLYFSVYIIGARNTVISYVIYYILGIVGLPVFSGFTGGFAKAVGPTGGYLIGFVFMIIICGIFVKMFKSKLLHIMGMVLGTAAAYAVGTAWYCFEAKSNVISALAVCVAPFIIGDIIKIILAAIFGPKIKKRVNFI